MRSIASLLPLPGPLRIGVVSPDRVLRMGEIELNSVLMVNADVDILICCVDCLCVDRTELCTYAKN